MRIDRRNFLTRSGAAALGAGALGAGASGAEAAKRRIEAFLAREAQAELKAMHVVRGPRDIDAIRSPRFVVDFLEYRPAR